MTTSETNSVKPLAGWRVLVPRGGPWGDGVAASLRAQGAIPVVAPLINVGPTTDQAALDTALEQLAAGAFDWLTITSATTFDVLFAHGDPETVRNDPKVIVAYLGTDAEEAEAELKELEDQS